MPTANIRLEVDPVTRKRTVVISYESDEDALPHEHEQAHRDVVERLLEKGIVGAGDVVVVEREGTRVPVEPLAEGPGREGEKRKA